MSQTCAKCGEEVEAEDCDRPCDAYMCDCGHSWIDIDGYTDRMADFADNLRKRKKEGWSV